MYGFLVLEINNAKKFDLLYNRSENAGNSNKCGDEDNCAQLYNPQFKGFTDNLLHKSGWFMNKIEQGGFLVLFLVQDFLGMTMPRTLAGFLRDKEETGNYNIQEGFEVLGREMLTGPIMMSMAPISLLIAAQFAKSTSTNSDLIKYYGNSLKEYVSQNNFDKNLLNDAKGFKSEFIKSNVEKILEKSFGKENVSEESVKYICNQLNKMENIPQDVKLKKFRGKANYRNECMDNIVNHINNLRYKAGTDLEVLNKVKIGSGKSERIFKINDTLKALLKYTDDAITTNKKLDKLDKALAESLKHKALGKRVLTNLAIFSATIGVLQVLPKIYAKSNTAPGSRKKKTENAHNKDIAFKGKWNLPENIGKIMDKNNNKFVSSELEYNGHNFTNTLFAILSAFGMITGRTIRAYKRADKDENGKRDYTEIWEILTRDIASSLSVIFAVPMITRAAVSSYEKHSGFVLMNKDRSVTSKAKKILDLMNPYSKSHVFTNSEMSAIYNNIDSKEKMINFCKFIDKNGGDLEKIISKSEHKDLLFKNITEIKGKERSIKNKEILTFFENIEKNIKNKNISSEEFISKLMKGAKDVNTNKIFAFARGMNSVPGLITTFLISPYILGWFIPRLTYKNTRRIHAKQEQDELKSRKMTTVSA